MRLKFDPEWCTGCQACVMACLDQRDVRPAVGQSPLCRLEAVEETGRLSFAFVTCIQCGRCAAVCPTGCLTLTPQGIIAVEESLCVGCRQCEELCPHGVISWEADSGYVKKCDVCLGRVMAGLPPACVHTCPTGALRWEE